MRKTVTQQQSGKRRDRAASLADALPGYREADGLYLPLTLSEEGFGYSDGDEAESYLDELIARTADRSLFSPALLNGIRDWPSRYHLSPKRANLLRPFAEHLRGDVLEVGAGCGAITRFLGENGGAIVAVEGSARRARIARARTAELKNVSVVCDRIEALRTTKRFDAITVIGVLEYARNFGEAGGVAAQAAMLSHLRGLLAQHGVVILAIENRLGLKYFAGAREDHEGMPFFGINDSYRMDGSATFGRAELGALLDQAGLGHQAWFVPCPDYKLPVTIVAPARARDQTELISTLLAQSVTVDPQGIADPTFSLEQAWSAICQNGLLEHLANSFLVIAGATPQAIARLSGAADMAWHYSVERHPAFVKQARFVRTGGDVTVIRRRLTDAATPDVPLACRLADETCIAGRNWWRELVLIGNRPGWTVADLAAWARVWCDALKKECRIKEMDASSLAAPVAGRHFDATPFNMVRRADGSVDFFDREWDVVPKLEFGFVMFRGLRDSLLRVTSYAEPANDTPVIANDLALAILVELGLLVTKIELERYAHMEAQIQNWVRGTRAVPGADEASAWSWRAALRIRLPAERDAQAQAVAQWQARLSEAVRQTHAARADAEALRTRTAGLAAEHDADRAEAERSLAALTQERDAARAREYEARMQVQSLAGELDLVRDHLAQKRSALATAQEQAAVQSEAHRAETNALRAQQDLLRHTVTRQAGAIAAAETKQARRPFAAATRALARRFARFRREPAGAPAWEVEAIRQSRLFSPRWYLTRHPDVAAAGADALTHYLTRGAREGRDPHPLFDARWYAAQYPKAREAAMSPLAHYATVGVPEGLDPHPLFDTDFYLRANPDVATTHGNPLFHYMAHGAYEGRDPHPLFDSSWYLERNPDVAAARDNPLVHYITHGWKEGRDPHPEFDARWYLDQNADVAAAQQNPLEHYVLHGEKEGRKVRGDTASHRHFLAPPHQHPLAAIDAAGAASPKSEISEAQNIGEPTKKIDAASDPIERATGRFLTFVLERTKRFGRIDAMILLPILGRGGSEKVALNFARVILESRSNVSVLLIVTDHDLVDSEIAVPEGAIVARLSDFAETHDEALRQTFLFRVVQIMRPRILHVINSELGWRTVDAFGERLERITNVFGSMFCLQRDFVTDELVGYAASFYPTATRYCRALISDNETFLEQAQKEFMSFGRATLLPIYNPAAVLGDVPRHVPKERPAILWAGRLDRQKRIDVLFDIAERMLDVDFYYFGTKVTDGDVSLRHGGNVQFGGGFTDPMQLFAKRGYDAYIHTAREEGMPNMLLEIGSLGVPIIAPAIGGIPELVNDRTGYLLSSWPTAAEYEQAIRRVFQDRAEAINRADAMRRLISERHSWEAFKERVRSLVHYV